MSPKGHQLGLLPFLGSAISQGMWNEPRGLQGNQTPVGVGFSRGHSHSLYPSQRPGREPSAHEARAFDLGSGQADGLILAAVQGH